MSGKQTHIFGEHAEDEPVGEVRDGIGIVTALPQCLRDGHEGRRHALRERVACLAWTQPPGVRERPLKLVTGCPVGEVAETEFVDPADAVRPVGVDAEPQHVGNDQKRRVLER